MGENSYWDSFRSPRFNRRGLIRRAARTGAVVGVIGLAGCMPTAGSQPATAAPPSGPAGTAAAPTATAPQSKPAQPKRGGTIGVHFQSEAPQYDPHQTISGGLLAGAGAAYGR